MSKINFYKTIWSRCFFSCFYKTKSRGSGFHGKIPPCFQSTLVSPGGSRLRAKRSAQRRRAFEYVGGLSFFSVPRTNILRSWKLMARAPKRRGWSRRYHQNQVTGVFAVSFRECRVSYKGWLNLHRKKLWPVAMDYKKPLEMFTMVRTLIPSTSRSRAPNSLKVDGPYPGIISYGQLMSNIHQLSRLTFGGPQNKSWVGLVRSFDFRVFKLGDFQFVISWTHGPLAPKANARPVAPCFKLNILSKMFLDGWQICETKPMDSRISCFLRHLNLTKIF